MAIQSFGDKNTEDFFKRKSIRKGVGWKQLTKIITRKLDMLHYASTLEDLKSPPGNQLEKLRGDLAGFFSIRINDQWRIIFRWTNAGPDDVQIVDYHQ